MLPLPPIVDHGGPALDGSFIMLCDRDDYLGQRQQALEAQLAGIVEERQRLGDEIRTRVQAGERPRHDPRYSRHH